MTPSPKHSEGLQPVELSFACPKEWDGLSGQNADDKKRFCDLCQKDVHNLSAMTTQEATAFLDQHQGQDQSVCITYEHTSDGYIKTRDNKTTETSPPILQLLSQLLNKPSISSKAWAATVALLIVVSSYASTSKAWASAQDKAPCKVDTSRSSERVVGEMLVDPPQTTTTQDSPKPTRTLGKIKPPPKPKPPEPKPQPTRGVYMPTPKQK